MQSEETKDTTAYKVVVNHEEQHSIWPADRDNPLGWRDAGRCGLKDACLAYIKEVWTDLHGSGALETNILFPGARSFRPPGGGA